MLELSAGQMVGRCYIIVIQVKMKLKIENTTHWWMLKDADSNDLKDESESNARVMLWIDGMYKSSYNYSGEKKLKKKPAT